MKEQYTPGTTVESIAQKGFSRKVTNKLSYWEDLTVEMTDGKETFLDLLDEGAKRRISIKTTAKQIGIEHHTLARIYREAGIPILSKEDAARASLEKLKQDPGFQKKQAAAARASLEKRRQDPDFREKSARALREAQFKEENQGKYYLPTIQGERRDIGYAHSSYEANIARVLTHIGREYVTHQPIQLEDGSQMELDFMTVNPRGKIVCYEIMAPPHKDPKRWDKLTQAQKEHPELTIRPITERLYKKLEKRFINRINADPALRGWETKYDNLRNNPAKYEAVKKESSNES